jgi:hypothetical protein
MNTLLKQAMMVTLLGTAMAASAQYSSPGSTTSPSSGTAATEANRVPAQRDNDPIKACANASANEMEACIARENARRSNAATGSKGGGQASGATEGSGASTGATGSSSTGTSGGATGGTGATGAAAGGMGGTGGAASGTGATGGSAGGTGGDSGASGAGNK